MAKISLGNWLTIAALACTAFWGYSRLAWTVDDLVRRNTALEAQVDSMQRDADRITQKLEDATGEEVWRERVERKKSK